MSALGDMYLYCTGRVSPWAAASSVLIEFERHSPDLFQAGASEPKATLIELISMVACLIP